VTIGLVPDAVASEPWAESFVDLYRAERVAMVRLAFLLTGGDAAAEELVHDAFLSLHRRWDRVENPGGYLRTTVVNACRSHQRRHAIGDRVLPRSVPDVIDAPDELADAIGRLPERQRAAVVLRYYADLPEAEIAATLGCGIPAVKSLLHRALGTLREVIER
jgi:RNA polymerase sigma-70 factor (sigma-E family)